MASGKKGIFMNRRAGIVGCGEKAIIAR